MYEYIGTHRGLKVFIRYCHRYFIVRSAKFMDCHITDIKGKRHTKKTPQKTNGRGI